MRKLVKLVLIGSLCAISAQALAKNQGKTYYYCPPGQKCQVIKNYQPQQPAYYQQRNGYNNNRGYNNASYTQGYSDEAPSRQMSGGSHPSKQKGTGNRVFVFSPAKLSWAAYDESGNLVRSGRASGGRHYCPDVGRSCRTPSGTFKVYSKGGSDCKSSKYPLGVGGAPMPYCMFFHGGYAIHGSPDVPDHNASHGCIRVHPADSHWLSTQFIKHGTTVRVTGYGT